MKKVLIFLALILFVRCTQKIAGTTDETMGGNKTAAIYYAGGAPAPGVTVKVFDVIDTSRVPVAQAVTDSAGHYALGQVAKGTYNIWAEQDTLVAVQDSVFISPNSNTIQHDTLHTSGSITAIIGMQPNDDPRSAYVQMMGSDRFSRNIDANSFFTISGLATGSYSLRISTTLPNYTPTFFIVSAISGRADTLKDTLKLVYTGIPVVTGLSASYDTVNGIVHLTWNSTSFRDFQDYLVFRDPCDSIQPSILPTKSLTDTVFSDTIFKKKFPQGQYSFSDTNDYCLKYRVCIRNNSNIQGLTYKYIAVVAASPLYKIPQVKIVSSDTMYCNTPMTISATIFSKSPTIKKCEWKIGETGQYATTSVTLPETTIVFPDTLLPYLRCYIRATNNNGVVVNDSMDLRVLISWKQVSNGIGPLIPMNGIVFNNQLIVYGQSYFNNVLSMAIWSSSDGVTWTILTNSLPFVITYSSSMVNFKNEIWLFSDSTIWHSKDGITWNSVGIIPMLPSSIVFFTVFNNTLYMGDTSSSKGTIWTSNDGLSWNTLKASDGSPIKIPFLNSDSLNSFNSRPNPAYSTVLINDTLFISYTQVGTTSIWKIIDWAMPTLLVQYTNGLTAQLVEFSGKLCIFDTPNSGNFDTTYSDKMLFFDNTGLHFISTLPVRVFTPVETIQQIAFKGKIYSIASGQGTWVSK